MTTRTENTTATSSTSHAVAPPHPGVQRIPAFKDNYIWLIVDATGRHAALVDPGDGEAAAQAIRDASLTLTDVLVTHHHADHVGGLDLLKSLWPQARIHAPHHPRIPGADQVLQGGEQIHLDAIGITLEVIAVPGHTLDHLAYLARHHGSDPRPLLFCGDTLFAGGCGRLFEGTPAQMHGSLSTLAALPGETLVYCAHEYTESNLRFAAKVEPENPDLRLRIDQVWQARRDGLATVPSTLQTEWRTNPFLRVNEPSVISTASAWRGETLSGPVDCLAAVRAWKDAG